MAKTKGTLFLPWPPTWGQRGPILAFPADGGIHFNSQGLSCDAVTGKVVEIDLGSYPRALVSAMAASGIEICTDPTADGGNGAWERVTDPATQVPTAVRPSMRGAGAASPDPVTPAGDK